MKFFLDTANLNEIEKYSYIIDGVTTNPSLLAKEMKSSSQNDLLKKICDTVKGPVSLEVISQNCDEMIKEALELSSIADNVVVKVPMTPDGLKATKKLSEMCVKTNVTLIFSSNQALLAAKAGATYVSIFVGRLDDIGYLGMNIVKETAKVLENYNFDSEIITASIRNPMHVLDAALSGSHVATVPPNVLKLMFNHNLTDVGLQKFMDDWRSVKNNSNNDL